jgi:ParB/RepB/Spo0J family partition protein
MAKKDFAAMEARGPSGDTAARAAMRSRTGNPTSVRLDEVQPNPDNPRYSADDPEVRELAETLNQVGQLQAALVVSREQYLDFYPEAADTLGPERWIVAVGNRRLAATRLAGRTAFEVRVASDVRSRDAFEDMILVENIQRVDLPPLLEAERLQRRLNRPGQSMRTVGEAIGKSHAYVQQRVGLLRMIPEFQELLKQDEINVKLGRWLGTQDEDVQRSILAEGPPYEIRRAQPRATPEVVNPVSTDSAANVNSGSSAAEAIPVNPVSTDSAANVNSASSAAEAIPVNPVSTSEAGAVDEDPAGTAVSRTAGIGSGGVAAGPGAEGGGDRLRQASDTEPADRLEETRTSVAQWLDSALGELDRALPDGGDGALGKALADARRHLLDARSAIERIPARSVA